MGPAKKVVFRSGALIGPKLRLVVHAGAVSLNLHLLFVQVGTTGWTIIDRARSINVAGDNEGCNMTFALEQQGSTLIDCLALINNDVCSFFICGIESLIVSVMVYCLINTCKQEVLGGLLASFTTPDCQLPNTTNNNQF